MLLTVIAVATLLVAVVGATFAYFSISTAGTTTSTTVVNTQAQKLPIITMTAGKANFGISVTATDMALNNPGARWAMYTGDEEGPENVSSGKNEDANLYHWSASEVKYDLFNIKATETTSSENDTLQYECPITITLTVKDKVEELTEGDLILYLYSKDGDVLVSEPADGDDTANSESKTNALITDWENSTNSYLMEKSSTSTSHAGDAKCTENERGCYDISSLFELKDETKTLHTVVIVSAGNKADNGTTVEASMKLVNSATKDQSDLAGQDIRVTLTSKLAEGGCKVITKK